jgi:hypothetical protein
MAEEPATRTAAGLTEFDSQQMIVLGMLVVEGWLLAISF